MTDEKAIALKRDCAAILIPSGEKVTMAAGSKVWLTQALGGGFTLMTDHGYMVRLDGADADALGVAPAAGGVCDAGAETNRSIEDRVWHQLRSCFDPEIPINIVDLGLVYSCEVRSEPDGRVVSIEMTLTAPGCGMGEVLVQDIREKVELIPTVKRADVELVFDPPWNQTMMTEAARLQTGMM